MDELTLQTHTRFMEQALIAARQALPQDVPVGALLVRQGEIIATACNRRERDHNPVGHAEILLLQAAGRLVGNWRLTDCTLYVTLEPCPMCAAAIAQARVGQVVFGAYDALMGGGGSRYALLDHTTTLGGIHEEACQGLLQFFFRRDYESLE